MCLLRTHIFNTDSFAKNFDDLLKTPPEDDSEAE